MNRNSNAAFHSHTTSPLTPAALAFAAGTMIASASLAQTGAQPTNTPATQPANPAGVQSFSNAPAQPATTPAAEATQPATGAAAQPENTDAAQPTGEPVPTDGIRVNENQLVDIHVKDTDLGVVLEMLSIQSQKNIVASKGISAKVTANLYGVTFYEALDAILHVNGYGYIERGNFVYVYTLEELKAIEQASRQRVAKVLKLNYLNAVDAAGFAKPLLSADGGAIQSNGKTGNFQVSDSAPVGGDDFAHDATLVVFDYPENIEEIEKLLKQLDTRPQQILVESTILETRINEDNAFGIDFALVGNLNFTQFQDLGNDRGGPLKGVDRMLTGRAAQRREGVSSALTQSVGNVANGRGGVKAGIILGDFAGFLRALDEVTDTTVLSSPKVLALNRQPARVLVGQRVGYVTSTNSQTSTTQTVQFLDTGTQLDFRAFVSNDGMIRMELKPKVSSAAIREVTTSGGGAVTIPDEDTSQLSTNVLVRDGQTVVLGGLFKDSTKSSRRQVPVLGDIPLLGNAFRSQDDEVRRSEMIFLIRPQIMNDTVLTAAGQRADENVQSVIVGAREGLLPFSRQRMVGQLLVEADRLAAEGNTEKALHQVQRALALHPQNQDAVLLRDRLTGERAGKRNRGRGLFDDILRTETNKAVDALNATPTPQGQATPAQSETVQTSQTQALPVQDQAPQTEPTAQADVQPARVETAQVQPEQVQPEQAQAMPPALTTPAASQNASNEQASSTVFSQPLAQSSPSLSPAQPATPDVFTQNGAPGAIDLSAASTPTGSYRAVAAQTPAVELSPEQRVAVINDFFSWFSTTFSGTPIPASSTTTFTQAQESATPAGK
ncbi:MAG: secretin N-terminal domain-containing protein [Planctomycetota bacterium]|nr:secretin N-terminal domain-containing protein [Planctomycetota bacterium]